MPDPTLSINNLTLAMRGTGKPSEVAAGRAFGRIQGWASSVLLEIQSLRTAIAAITVSSPVSIKFNLLTANLTVDFPSDPNGTILVYLLRQDGIGGWTVIWPGVFTDTVQPEITPNLASAIFFYKESESLIYPCTPFIGGVGVP